jgi:hypothetical protein
MRDSRAFAASGPVPTARAPACASRRAACASAAARSPSSRRSRSRSSRPSSTRSPSATCARRSRSGSSRRSASGCNSSKSSASDTSRSIARPTRSRRARPSASASSPAARRRRLRGVLLRPRRAHGRPARRATTDRAAREALVERCAISGNTPRRRRARRRRPSAPRTTSSTSAPGAGPHGGRVVAEGHAVDAARRAAPDSHDRRAASRGRRRIAAGAAPTPALGARPPPPDRSASEGCDRSTTSAGRRSRAPARTSSTVVTGGSGSGKSSRINRRPSGDVLSARALRRPRDPPAINCPPLLQSLRWLERRDATRPSTSTSPRSAARPRSGARDLQSTPHRPRSARSSRGLTGVPARAAYGPRAVSRSNVAGRPLRRL